MHAKRLRTGKQLAAALTVLFLPLAVHAAEPVVPGAGSILQQTQPVMPPAPSATGTGLAIEQPDGGSLPPSAPFLVRTIQLSGNSAFDTPTLHALIAEAEGKSLTLPQLARVAARITDYYHRHGYPLDRAIVPAQTIQGGMVRIEIIEARYGQIALNNRSRVVDPLLQATLAPLQSGQAITDTPLNRALLLLSDIPGVAVVATLKPGQTVGTSDLQLQTDPTPVVTGNAALDNDGNRYTGRARLGGTVSVIDPVQHGDTLSLSALTSGDMDYGSLSYDWLLNGEGSRLGGSYSALHYILADTLAPLDGRGSAEVESLWVRHPFVRTPTINLYGQLQYDHKQLDDAIGVSDLHTDRHLDSETASVAGDLRDSLLSGGINTWSLGWTSGRVGFDDASARLADAATANTQGRFSLWNATLSRLQHLSANDAVYVAISGQWSNANLDPAQKMIAGGAYTVRAYDMGALSADSGILASAEWRHDLGVLWQGHMQAVGFADREHVTINHTVWAAGSNNATLSGAGVGLNCSWSGRWNANASIAAPLGSRPALIGSNNSARLWLALSKGF
ncbi:MAG TPA: ShlB/FhaC/HecB family hemolysin secretion/activation protein [Steroidobacteraceae bacterium]|jgi:hemolysin activation/secretion protein|nr:ShlB/FhaC/HecB family hemolysin secretion/activation protein [Steroidobacteraceae bacterium]